MYCGKCGKRLEEGELYCNNCGALYNWPEKHNSKIKTKTKKSRIIRTIFLLIISVEMISVFGLREYKIKLDSRQQNENAKIQSVKDEKEAANVTESATTVNNDETTHEMEKADTVLTNESITGAEFKWKLPKLKKLCDSDLNCFEDDWKLIDETDETEMYMVNNAMITIQLIAQLSKSTKQVNAVMVSVNSSDFESESNRTVVYSFLSKILSVSEDSVSKEFDNLFNSIEGSSCKMAARYSGGILERVHIDEEENSKLKRIQISAVSSEYIEKNGIAKDGKINYMYNKKEKDNE